MKLLTLHLCCNNEHGNHTGMLEQIELFAAPADMLLKLECVVERAEPVLSYWPPGDGPGKVQIGRRVFPYERLRRHVGNVYWDAITVKPKDAAAIVTHVLRLRTGKTADVGAFKFESTEHACVIEDAVDRRRITADDVARAVRE